MTDPRLSGANRGASSRTAYIDLAREADFTLGAAVVRPSSGEVVGEAGSFRLQPRVMQVLVALVHAQGEVVSRDQLVSSCWGGLAVGDDAINRCIGQLRRLAEADVPGTFAIETLPRIGYRLTPGIAARQVADRAPGPPPAGGPQFVHPSIAAHPSSPVSPGARTWFDAPVAWAIAVVAGAVGLGATYVTLVPPRAEPVPAIYTVAIMPIRNLTGDPSLDTAADTLTEDVSHVLGRGGYMHLAPHDATFAWKGKSVDERQLGRALHVRHVVNASLRKADNAWRVTYQIVDTTTDLVVDSEDIGQPLSGGALPEHALAMTMYENITDVLHKRWTAEELAKPPDDRDPGNVLARLETLESGNRQQTVAEVERLTRIGRSVIGRDSSLRLVFEMDTCWYYASLIDRRTWRSVAQRQAWTDTALDASRQASDARPHATSPHACRAEVFGLLGRWDEGTAEARYIIANFPLTVAGYESLANLELEQGDFRDALKDFTKVADMNAGHCSSGFGEVGGCHGELGLLHLFLGEYGAAIGELREQAVEEPKNPFPPFFLGAALELSGAHDAAMVPAGQYRKLETDDGPWRVLSLSNEPAFLGAARTVRNALHAIGLDEPHVATK
ncbi:MAG: winged helix-turn-helix domain-containing protein [Rhizomicrobium sp.]|jgi:TolB-like protein/DNA-binding winged helix-turn-helix (wHTH) protein